MSSLNVVVPFTVFTEYRDRRSRSGNRGGDAETATLGDGAAPPSQEASGCLDTLPVSLPASAETAAETTALTEPVTERIPS